MTKERLAHERSTKKQRIQEHKQHKLDLEHRQALEEEQKLKELDVIKKKQEKVFFYNHKKKLFKQFYLFSVLLGESRAG